MLNITESTERELKYDLNKKDIMNHIDKQVVFIIPLSKVPIMVH